MSKIMRRGEFTGWHMLMVMVAFFGTIIAVNITLAVMASRSWTGVVVENPYIASQEFNSRAEEARAQAALGWTADLQIKGGTAAWRLVNAEGVTLYPEDGTIHFRHTVYDSQDFEAEMTAQADGALVGQVTAADGDWIVTIEARIANSSGLDHPYRDTQRITLRDGVIR